MVGRTTASRAAGIEPLWRSSTFHLALALLLFMVPAGILAWQAAATSDSHFKSAEAMVRDFASVGAEQFRERFVGRLFMDMTVIPFELLHVGAAKEGCRLPTRLDYRDSMRKRSTPPKLQVVSFFRVRGDTSELQLSESNYYREEREWIQKLLSASRRELDEAKAHQGFVLRTFRSEPRLFLYRIMEGESPGQDDLYGFEADPDVLKSVSAACCATPLLPAKVYKESARTPAVSILVETEESLPIYEMPRPAGKVYSSTIEGLPELGNLRVQSRIPSSAADGLVTGGVPSVGGMWILILLGAMLFLAVMAFLLMRREHELAILRSDFIASVSHDLRTPLAQIRLFAETLALDRVRTPEEEARAVRVIDQEARRLTWQVENVLQYSRSQRGGLQVALKEQDPNRLVSEIVEAFTPIARKGRAEVSWKPEPVSNVWVDEGGFRRILLNLLDNALKYGPPNQEIVVRAFDREGWVTLCVEDEGPGIPPAERDRIWRQYHRGRGARNSSTTGSGIGLFLVDEFAAAFGGRARVKSGPRGGALFAVDFPIRTES